jgi:glycosyltransferase involved in cell wall biosynthesis
MRVSIITPSKNQGRYIDHCLRSVHEQTHREIEHIVLDGMSEDESAEIAAQYPCTFLQATDSGPAQAINRGLAMATGDIVCWLNADDAFSSRFVLERVARIFMDQPEIDIISGNGYYIDEGGKYLCPIVNADPMRFNAKWIKRRDFILQPATFWRRNEFRLDESLKYCFDWKLWIDLFDAGLNIMYVPEYFAVYRIQPSSLTHQDTASRKGEIYRLVKSKNKRGLPAMKLWVEWKMYQLSETVHVPQIKRLVRLADFILSAVSGGMI